MPINTSPQYVDLKNILHHPDKSITYISNPKAACSTIKNSLLGGCTGNVHRAIEEICEYPNDSNHEIITITRNPYSRAISCYKNKIGWGKETTGNVWLPFARAFGFNAHAKPTFLEFLKALSSTKNQSQPIRHPLPPSSLYSSLEGHHPILYWQDRRHQQPETLSGTKFDQIVNAQPTANRLNRNISG